jgi:hypothetical protein
MTPLGRRPGNRADRSATLVERDVAPLEVSKGDGSTRPNEATQQEIDTERF